MGRGRGGSGLAATLVLHLPVTVGGITLGQTISAVTHYWADRRTTLAALARRLGKAEFYSLGAPRPTAVVAVNSRGRRARDAEGRLVMVPVDAPTLGTGSYVLDQSWHWLWVGLSALATVLV